LHFHNPVLGSILVLFLLIFPGLIKYQDTNHHTQQIPPEEQAQKQYIITLSYCVSLQADFAYLIFLNMFADQ
jgi:hypothetical protein